MFSKIIAVIAFVAYTQAVQLTTSYSTVGNHLVPAAQAVHVAPVAHIAHVAPVAHVSHIAPVAHYAHAAPVQHVQYAHAAPVQHVQYAHVAPVLKAVHQEQYADAHPHYSFEYGVQDAHTHDIKNQHEERDGDVVKGVYSLVQPDGVTRIVHYTADHHNGFNAQVEYKGHAAHPQIVQKQILTQAYHH